LAVISMKNLLESGVHFGHRTDKMHPNMKEYVYTVRNGINIIDLQKASQMIDRAYEDLKKVVEEGKTLIFVGTKKQSQDTIALEAKRCGMYYVNSRWLGGTLTNMKTVRKSVGILEDLEKLEESNKANALTKKEVAIMMRKREKLRRNLGGIKEMTNLPGAMFVVDLKKDHVAVAEAKRLGIPVFAMVDTNCDPKLVDHVIPSNDDATRSIKLITKMVSDAVMEGRKALDDDDMVGNIPSEDLSYENEGAPKIVKESVDSSQQSTEVVNKESKGEEGGPKVEAPAETNKEN